MEIKILGLLVRDDLPVMFSDARAAIEIRRLRQDLQFNRDSLKRCTDLAAKCSALPIKKRLEALARKYQDRAVELERQVARSSSLGSSHVETTNHP
jgi:ribonuclease PH